MTDPVLDETDMQLLGLRALYQHHMAFLDHLEAEADRLTGETTAGFGYTNDWLNGVGSAAHMSAADLRAFIASAGDRNTVSIPDQLPLERREAPGK